MTPVKDFANTFAAPLLHARRALPASVLLAWSVLCAAEVPGETFKRTATPASLFPPELSAKLGSTLPPDRRVQWTVRLPATLQPAGQQSGVLVFVSPTAAAAPRPGWTKVLDDRNLIWVAAEDFGNSQPAAQRVMAALMGLTLVEQSCKTDPARLYIAGMSGGGRVASMTMTRFPQLFSGALYIVGANFWTADDAPDLTRIAAKRFVFLTGRDDFNRSEVRQVYRNYTAAGVRQTLLLDLPHFGHQYPDPAQLDAALGFLDTGIAPDPGAQ